MFVELSPYFGWCKFVSADRQTDEREVNRRELLKTASAKRKILDRVGATTRGNRPRVEDDALHSSAASVPHIVVVHICER